MTASTCRLCDATRETGHQCAPVWWVRIGNRSVRSTGETSIEALEKVLDDHSHKITAQVRRAGAADSEVFQVEQIWRLDR